MPKNLRKMTFAMMAGCAFAGALYAAPAFARGGVGMGAMGRMSGMHGNFGGSSASHIGAQGLVNTNGFNASDRAFGQDRADLRRNANGVQTGVSRGTMLITGSRIPVSVNMNARGSASAHAADTQASGSTNMSSSNSAAHISAQGLANTNGINAATKLHGRDRANVRMSAQGLAHSKADLHANAHASGSTDTDTDTTPDPDDN